MYENSMEANLIQYIYNKNKYIAELIEESTYLENELPRETSYVAATVHPTISKLCSSISLYYCHPRARHDLYKEQGTSGSHIARYTPRFIQANPQSGLSGC